MNNPFKKEQPAEQPAVVIDGVSIKLNNAVDADENTEEVDVVELFDENGDSMVFEVLASSAYLGDKYFIVTIYLDDEPEEDDQRPINEVFLLKELFVNDDAMLEPVTDTALSEKLFDAFCKASGEKFDFA